VSRSIHEIIEAAVTIRGIVDLLEAGPATTHEIAMTQHLSSDSALRFCKKLQGAGIIDHPTATRVILGLPQKVPLMEWQLTAAYCRHSDDLPTAEELAGGMA
jgi:hypothetical protein